MLLLHYLENQRRRPSGLIERISHLWESTWIVLNKQPLPRNEWEDKHPMHISSIPEHIGINVIILASNGDCPFHSGEDTFHAPYRKKWTMKRCDCRIPWIRNPCSQECTIPTLEAYMCRRRVLWIRKQNECSMSPRTPIIVHTVQEPMIPSRGQNMGQKKSRFGGRTLCIAISTLLFVAVGLILVFAFVRGSVSREAKETFQMLKECLNDTTNEGVGDSRWWM